jgi:hypothetical protein
MLKIQDPISNLKGVPVSTIMSLERIGIQYVIQLVTMTESQIFCIKGIEEPDLHAIVNALSDEGYHLPQKSTIISVREDGMSVVSTEVDIESIPEQMEEVDVVVGITVNIDTGRIELAFPPGIQMVAFLPSVAVELANKILKKSRTLMN